MKKISTLVNIFVLLIYYFGLAPGCVMNVFHIFAYKWITVL